MTIIETPRLILREFEEGDIPALAAIYADPEGMRSKGGPRPYGYAEHTVREARQDYQRQGYGCWAAVLKESGSLIGWCGLLDQTVQEMPVVEVAYNLAKPYWGRGLATEAAQAIKAWGFERLPVERLVSLISLDNSASQNVARKNGMALEQELFAADGRKLLVFSVSRASFLE